MKNSKIPGFLSALALAFMVAFCAFGAEKKPLKPYVPPTIVSFSFYNPRIDKGMLFYPNEEVKIRFAVDNDRKNEAVGDFRLTLTDVYGKETVLEEQKNMKIAPRGKYRKDLSFTFDGLGKRYGVYKLKAQFVCQPKTLYGESSFVYIKKPRELTDDQRTRSPWGLNTLAADDSFDLSMYENFGMVWIRDYGFRYGWIKGARGKSDKPSYVDIWPWYQRQFNAYNGTKLRLLACFQDSLNYKNEKREMKDTVPDEEWLKEFRMFLEVFGKQGHAWQIDNEHYLGVTGDPARKKAYEEFTAAWAKLLKDMKINGYIVENGRAGVSVASSADCADSIKNGAFKNIDALAGHFYCRIPEMSTANANTNYKGEQDAQLLFDTLKDFSKAAKADGNSKREAWVTEFGWDTLVGKPPVTREEQAAYAQRGYLMGLYAGLGKMFWFFYKDDGKASVFFDGCGVYDPWKQAKPVLPAMAHLFHSLYDFKVIGRFAPHPNTMGYICEQDGKYVVCVFKIKDGEDAPGLKFDAGWTDMYGNPIPEGENELQIGPYWKTDIGRDNPWFKALSYDLVKGAGNSSPGGYVELEIETRGRFGEAVSGEYEVQLAEGWSSDKPSGKLEAAPGKAALTKFKVNIPEGLPRGQYSIPVKVTDASGEVKFLVYYLKIWSPITVELMPLAGDEGKPTKLSFVTYSDSPMPQKVTYRPVVPASWKVSPKTQTFTLNKGDLYKGFVKVDFDLTWNRKIKAGEHAYLDVIIDGRVVERRTLPLPFQEINKVGDIKLDGDLSDWPEECRIDLDSVGIAGYPGGRWTERAVVIPNRLSGYIGYKDDGIYYAFEVEESAQKTDKPLSFGNQECVEIFVDSVNNKTPRDKYAVSDYHFFVVPRLDLADNSVFAGRWPHGEIAKMQELKDAGFAKKVGKHGYVIEGRIPKSAIPSVELVPGAKIGLNFNLMNNRLNGGDKEELFWPSPIREDVRNKPSAWGTAFLK